MKNNSLYFVLFKLSYSWVHFLDTVSADPLRSVRVGAFKPDISLNTQRVDHS